MYVAVKGGERAIDERPPPAGANERRGDRDVAARSASTRSPNSSGSRSTA